MRKFRVLSLTLALVLLLANVLYAPVPKAEAKRSAAPSKGAISSYSAVLMDITTGKVLYEKNPHTKLYPASITKILTTYIAAERSADDEMVEFDRESCFIEGGAARIWPYTQIGEKISMKDCYYCMMLASANEVCIAVGKHISGSTKKFANLMNKKVKELGLKDTHFTNPNGLHDDNHYTTAYDMAVIGSAALQNPTFRKVTRTKTYNFKKTNKCKQTRYLHNHHNMLTAYTTSAYEYKYCIGGKTGYTRAAGNTLVTFAEKNGHKLCCVVMKGQGSKAGAPNIYTDTTTLMNYGFANYTLKSVKNSDLKLSDSFFNKYSSFFSDDNPPLKLSKEAKVILPRGVSVKEVKQKIEYKMPKSLKVGNNVIGHITYTYKGDEVGQSDIIYTKSKTPYVSINQSSGKKDGSNTTLINSKNKSNAFHNFFNNMRFKFMQFFGNLGTFFKNNLIIIIIIILVAVMGILVFLRRREIIHSRGSYKYASHTAKKSSSSDDSAIFSKGKRFKSKKQTKTVAADTGSTLSFSRSKRPKSRPSRFRRRTSTYNPNEGLHFSSKHKTTSAKTNDELGFLGASKTPDERAKKTKRRHKNTMESFGHNFYDYNKKKPKKR
ncbi:MAG: D-alanyl-D-alanine carboxypeptidase [Lachnospiraceae bacterium]|nr:D-alanyl-D-alanine carboxypeptidase [Lachnospiraceae bacterium]